MKVKGGEKANKVLADLAAKLSRPGTLRVGFLEGARYPDGTSVAMVAALQNFGTRTIPRRPFFTNMVKDKQDEWGPALAALLPAHDYDAKIALEILGEGIAGQLRQSIIDTYSPPLSPITVMLRGMRSHDQKLMVTRRTVGEAARRVAAGKTNYGASTKPLVDTGFMLGSVASEVK
ncbi:MAG: hypothetical protein GC190_19390 [Alphaproteobacteria bacterium]|nr:hypothetical protein [Alphaproteobacteria bacterium]